MSWLQLFRIAVMGWIIFCSLILLGLGAHLVSVLKGQTVQNFAWGGLAVATAVLTFVSVPAMIAIDMLRSGVFTSMIVVEIAWLSFLGVLFLATGGSAAATATTFWGSCSRAAAQFQGLCHETSATAAFGFLGWIPLWAYTITLLVMLVLPAQRSDRVWLKSVKEADLDKTAVPTSPIGPNAPMMGMQPYPPYADVPPQPADYSQGPHPQV
ncbi:uncharacterized protein BXZ73DRAFT_39403 [Epithele typhae]|uniref:uncharacterized protein n=1 Tax=Epithele typhae TaxID=378194 RepID=UPI00200881CD|nr:uncharacterized protein BXZ73DRAFT_39403 [Epithele typhae]KAH9944472.1 hypothetical protein BXZ73DRAFT_39403 [Epithele typhae]